LKFVPKQNDKELGDSHFRKINLPNAKGMLDDKVGATLDFLVYCGEAAENCSTTTWFVRRMNRWFKIVTSRNLSLALSQQHDTYLKATEDLELVIEVMKGMRLKGNWKVVQTHIIVATESVLAVARNLLSKPGYDFVMLGRFLQDVVENLFSVLRAICPCPTPLELNYDLRRFF